MAQVTANAAPLDLDAPGARNEGEAPEAGEHLAWLVAQSRAKSSDSHRFLLLLRFGVVNLVAFALLGVAATMGLVERVIEADRTYLSVLIFLVFLGGLGLCAVKIWRTSVELNRVRAFDPLTASRAADYLAKLRGSGGDSRGILATALRLKVSQSIAVVRHIAGSLVLLGLIGTVVGFIIALSGVDPENAADVKSVTPMVSTLIQGMSTALYTTLVGAVLNVWLMVNFQLLAGGTVKLITSILEFGEKHARA